MRFRHFIYSLPGIVICLMLSITYAGTSGVKKKRPRPNDYGNVLIDNYSSIANTADPSIASVAAPAVANTAAPSVANVIAPVVFRHWLHRAKYTCRLCHVDIGFAMVGGETDITCDDVVNGMYCGACHDGSESFARVEKGRGGKETFNCSKCHSYGREVRFKFDFRKFRRKLPRERFGNGIDWMKAEDDNRIKLEDYLESVSIKRSRKLKQPRELQVSTGEGVMPDIIFSHKKHAVWSGCELCHPDLFGVTPGDTVYSMKDIFDGKYCGVCHGIVAFPNNDCQRCHMKDVY
jgi:c(7)-type cytochrome triheme protein